MLVLSRLIKRLFPAHAGVILPIEAKNLTIDAIPRTRGGDPKLGADGKPIYSYSPHTRG